MASPRTSTTMAAGVDRISDLPDDLLQRILHFAPAKEAASTSALSTRWRSLWRSTSAVNLAVRVRHDDDFFSLRDAFVRSAKVALAAAAAAGGRHVTRPAMHVESERRCQMLTVDAFLHRSVEYWERKHDVVSHPVVRRVEELLVAAVVTPDFPSFDGEVTNREGEFRLCLGTQPSETLHVLDLTGCGGLSAGAALPRQTTLRPIFLHIKDLQGVIDSAPELATVHLESVFLAGTEEGCALLRFPAATALVMSNCGSDCYGCGGCLGATEIDAPRLRSFKYTGFARRFSLISPSPDMVRAELTTVHLESVFLAGTEEGCARLRFPAATALVMSNCGSDCYGCGGCLGATELHFIYHVQDNVTDNDMLRALFWRFLHNFRDVKSLKLKVRCLKNIAVGGKALRGELLLPLPGVERLELTALHDPGSETSAVAISNLLRCCPNVGDLVLRLNRKVPQDSLKNGSYVHDLLREQRRTDLDDSVHRFARRRGRSKPPTISMNQGGLDAIGDTSMG